jgi:MtrB/PioB family decaheme-associated outer membrane protein
MRGSRILLALALVGMPLAASAQDQPTGAAASAASKPAGAAGASEAAVSQAAEEEYVPPQKNTFDFGIRGTNITGDRARYERYRDLSDGLFLDQFRLHRQTSNDWFLDVAGDHVGRLDQRFMSTLVLPGKVNVAIRWDQLPTFMSDSARTLFTATSPDVLTLNPTVQKQVAASPSTLANFVRSDAFGLTIKSRRYIGEGKVEYIANPDLTFTQNFRIMDRNGAIPYGGSWGHGNFSETFAPVDHRLMDWNGNGEFSRGPVLFRAGYVASFFHNDYTSFTFDDPWRAVDAAAGAARGQSSLPPSNSQFGVNGMALVRLPGHTRASAYVSAGMLKDAGDTAILPQTLNSAVVGLQPLPRATVEGEGRTTSVNLTFTSRPVRYLDVNARFRRYEYDNRTPEFLLPQRVAYDNSPSVATYSSLGGVTSGPNLVTTEPFGITRDSLDLDVRVVPGGGTAAGIGYSRLADDRTHRFFERTTENIVRVTFEEMANKWFSLRTKFEHGQKRGDVTEEALLELWNIGEQPGMRQFDLASRDRDRATILGTVNLGSLASVNASFAAGKDDYIESEFGLRDNTNRVYGAGFDFAPTETMTLGLTYSFERYKALSRSRTASPPAANQAKISYDTYLNLVEQGSVAYQVADVSRNWADDSLDRVHTLVASADLRKIAEKLDLKFSVDLSRASTRFTYLLGPVSLLPGEPSLPTSLGPLQPLPDNSSNLGRTRVDGLYSLTGHLGVGVSYWYEQYRVKDFTLDEQATPTLNLAGSLLLGYLYRPYTANTVWGRVVYSF